MKQMEEEHEIKENEQAHTHRGTTKKRLSANDDTGHWCGEWHVDNI